MEIFMQMMPMLSSNFSMDNSLFKNKQANK